MNEQFERINELLPFYISLLTDKQQEILKLYFYEDLSLAEIGENLNISRNAVHDCIKKSSKILEDYESKLNLQKNYMLRNDLYIKLTEINNSEVNQIVNKLIDMEDK